MRAWARGYRCGVFQFVKSGKWKVGEAKAAQALGGIDWEKMGDGWTWISRDLEESADKAREGWAEVKRRIESERYEFLLLDELTYAIKYGWIPEEEIVADAAGPAGLPARRRDRPRRLAGADRGRGPRERGRQGQAPDGRGHPSAAGDRVVIPRIVIAGTSSGAGKTTIATGLMAALAARQRRPVQGRPGLHRPQLPRARGRPARTQPRRVPVRAGADRAARSGTARHGADVAVIEGVMGLYDGASGRGELASTAHVAKLLQAPVVLVVDAAAMARSVAAIVHGYRTFDPDVNVAGVILNRVGSEAHAEHAARGAAGHPRARRAAPRRRARSARAPSRPRPGRRARAARPRG